jgi:hypothetical protein
MSKQTPEVIVLRFHRMVDAVRANSPSLTQDDAETLRACADYVISTGGWTRIDFISLLMSLDPYPRRSHQAATAA